MTLLSEIDHHPQRMATLECIHQDDPALTINAEIHAFAGLRLQATQYGLAELGKSISPAYLARQLKSSQSQLVRSSAQARDIAQALPSGQQPMRGAFRQPDLSAIRCSVAP